MVVSQIEKAEVHLVQHIWAGTRSICLEVKERSRSLPELWSWLSHLVPSYLVECRAPIWSMDDSDPAVMPA